MAEYPEDDDALTRVTDGVWEMYKGEKADLTVWTSGDADEEIYALGDGLFKGNQHIRSFYPHHANWFTTIGAEAFKDSSLEYVELFDSITTIGPEAFANCKKLTSLDLPDSLTDIGTKAFAGCTGLKDLRIRCDASLLPVDAFQDCSALETLTLDKCQIPAGTFDGLDLKQVLLGADVTGADEGALAGVDRSLIRASDDMTEDQVAQLSADLGFPWYQGLLQVSDSSSLLTMPFEANPASDFEFEPETGTITAYTGSGVDVVIPRAIDGVPVKVLAMATFYKCQDYTDTDMETNQEDWVHLRSVVIPESVEILEDSLFAYCQDLKTVICYAPLESTGKNTFNFCRFVTPDQNIYETAPQVTIIVPEGTPADVQADIEHTPQGSQDLKVTVQTGKSDRQPASLPDLEALLKQDK
ncbi:MAG: leucine-rich repeat protein [Eubacteriales bacterium]|nr:leucine-rich repeat protein [Clostridiales bacterium]MDY5836092.1 leucine-rich repeat protein [Eubacteriales bacterium]